MEEGYSLVIPHTARDSESFCHRYVDLLRTKYALQLTTVVASEQRCRHSGTSRAMTKGKQYNSVYWLESVHSVKDIYNYVHAQCGKPGWTIKSPSKIFAGSCWGFSYCQEIPTDHQVSAIKLEYQVKAEPNKCGAFGEYTPHFIHK